MAAAHAPRAALLASCVLVRVDFPTPLVAVVHAEPNFLVDPRHASFGDVVVHAPEPLPVDPRLVR
jgi:hypothetical protein